MADEKPVARSGVTREEIIQWAGPSLFNQSLPILQSGSVSDVSYDPATGEIKGKILQKGFGAIKPWYMPVSFVRTAPGVIKSHCTCRANVNYGQLCQHVIAVGLGLLLQEMSLAKAEREKTAKQKTNVPEKPKAEIPKDDEDCIQIPLSPTFSVFVSGSRASLSVEVDAHYEKIEFPAASPQSKNVVWLVDKEDPLVRRTRSIEAERRALDYIESLGFRPSYVNGDVKFFITDPKKVLNFLGKDVPALRRIGWKVDFSERLMKVVDEMPYIVPVVKIKDAGNGDFLVRYDFEIGKSLVAPAEVQAAIARNEAYIDKEGKIILVDISAISEIHQVLSDCVDIQDDKEDTQWLKVAKCHAPFVKSSLEKIDAEIDTIEANEWCKIAKQFGKEEGDDKASFDPVQLGNFDKILRPYQKQGVYWIRYLESSGYGGILADEMGLGKTVQTLAWLSLHAKSPLSSRNNLRYFGPRRLRKNIELEARQTESISTSLIVCPTSLLWNWAAEIDKFIPDTKVLVVDEAPDSSDLSEIIKFYDLVITSYSRLHRDYDCLYKNFEFDAVILDEAQRIKNHRTKTSQATKLLYAKRRLVLTGTPVENTVVDVWSIFDFLMPGYLGDFETFKREYANLVAAGGPLGDEALAKLQRKIRPFILRRLKRMVAKDLPDKITKVFYSTLDEKSMLEYQSLLKKARIEIGNIVKTRGFQQSRVEILARLTKLRMIASRGKIDVFMEELQGAIEGGHRILVFSQFVSTLKFISQRLDQEKIKYCYLDGSTKDRLAICNTFNHDRRISVFLISLMAGGTGLNLTGADMVIHYDPWWNPAIEDQATDRAHRIGQSKNVYVMKMIASDTIEEKVLELQQRKKAIICATVSATDAAILSKLTADDVGQLLAEDSM